MRVEIVRVLKEESLAFIDFGPGGGCDTSDSDVSLSNRIFTMGFWGRLLLSSILFFLSFIFICKDQIQYIKLIRYLLDILNQNVGFKKCLFYQFA